jgi:hypothetical protein
MRLKHLFPPHGNPVVSPARALQQPSSEEVHRCPPDPILQVGDAATRNPFGTILLAEAELIREGKPGSGDFVIFAIGMMRQQRAHDRLEIRYCHGF